MSVIRTYRKDGAYIASIDGCQTDWCYGYGLTWEASIIDLLRSFKATLGLSFSIEPPVNRTVEPLDGLGPENANQELTQHADSWHAPYHSSRRPMPLSMGGEGTQVP